MWYPLLFCGYVQDIQPEGKSVTFKGMHLNLTTYFILIYVNFSLVKLTCFYMGQFPVVLSFVEKKSFLFNMNYEVQLMYIKN